MPTTSHPKEHTMVLCTDHTARDVLPGHALCGNTCQFAPASEPTIEDYPFRVGRMVYKTRDEAEAAIVRAKEIYPEADPKVLDRRVA